jgi:hypothetical protein
MNLRSKSCYSFFNVGRVRQREETTHLLVPEISAEEDLPNELTTDLYSASDAEGFVRPRNFLQTYFNSIIFLPRGASEFCSSPNCDVTKQQQCVQIVKRYNSTPTEPEEAICPSDPNEEYQILRHIVLLLILSCSMFVVSARLPRFNRLSKTSLICISGFLRALHFVCGPSLWKESVAFTWNCSSLTAF